MFVLCVRSMEYIPFLMHLLACQPPGRKIPKNKTKKTMGPVHVLRSCGDFLMLYNMSFHSLKIWASSFLPNEAAAEVRVLEELFRNVICQGIELLCNVFEFPLHQMFSYLHNLNKKKICS